MQPSLIAQLNQLNLDFYQTTATAFDDSRQQPWAGWQTLLPLVKSYEKPVIWDLGCGNGRFGVWLNQNQVSHQYLGWDTNQALLDKAHQALPQAKLDQLDIVQALLDHQLDNLLPTTPADLICLFGVLHHVPGKELREQLFAQLSQHLSPNGSLIFTVWRFDRDQQLLARQINAETLGIKVNELEPGDHFLDWQRGKAAVRYCHVPPESEISSWVAASTLKVISHFSADGKEKNLNEYYVLK